MLRRVAFLILTLSVSSALAKPAAKKSSVEDELRLKAGEEHSNEVKSAKAEMLIAKTEKQAMEQLDKLLKKHKGAALEPSLWFRKAELQMRQAKTSRFFEMNRESGVVRFLPQHVKSANSRQHIQGAVDTYEMIQRKFPNFRDMDAVIFNNAFSRQMLGQGKLARKLYRDVVTQFPNSELVPDSHLALGEMLFDDKEFAQALVEFEAIKKYPNSRVYPYGVYKAGWTQYNLRDTKTAIKELEVVVAFGKKVTELGLDARLDLRREALNDMVLFFEEVHPSDRAFEYFREQAGDLWVGDLMLRLSRLYDHHSRYADLEKVLREYIRELPNSPQRPNAHRDLVNGYENMKDRTKAVAQMQELADVCKVDSKWTKTQASRAQEVETPIDCQQTLKELTTHLAGKWHKSWRDKKGDEFGTAALKTYEIHLASLGQVDDRVRYNYGEILFEKNEFRKSSEQYSLVALSTKDTKLRHDSQYAACVALEKATQDKWNDADEKKFRDLAARYLRDNPKGEQVVQLKFKMAFIAYEKGRYDEAAPVFKQLGENDKVSQGLKSQDLYLDILNIQKKYEDLKIYSAGLLKSAMKEDRKKALHKIFLESSFAQIQKTEEAGQLDKAIVDYKKFAVDNASSHLADSAWINATALHFKLGQNKEGARSSHKYAQMFPQSKTALDALIKSVQTFESMAMLSEAAQVLNDLIQKDSKNATKWQMVRGDFLALSGDIDGAERIYRNLMTEKDPVVSRQATDKMFDLEKSSGRVARLEKLESEMVKQGIEPWASRAQLALAEKHFKNQKDAEAFRLAGTLLRPKPGVTADVPARARMLQAAVLEKEFRSQSVKAKPERLAMVLGMKTEKLDKAQQAYQDVLRYKDTDSMLAALEKLASCYGHFATAVRGIELKAEGVSKADVEAFEKEIDKLATPIEERQVDTLNQALAHAKRMEVRDGSIARIQGEINRLNMKRDIPFKLEIQAPAPALPKLARGFL